MTKWHKFLVSSISHAAISIHRVQFYISKYEWNLLLTTLIFQIEYKIFSEQNRGTRIIILLHDGNDSDLWLLWCDLWLLWLDSWLLWLDSWLLWLDLRSEQSWMFVNTSFICILIISINKNNTTIINGVYRIRSVNYLLCIDTIRNSPK